MLKQVITFLSLCPLCLPQSVKIPEISFNPEKYVCHYTSGNILIDGEASEKEWNDAEWTNNFVNIKGEKEIKPQFKTRVKMLWDNKYLYVYAELEEPDVWGTLTAHDDTMYYNNNFEVFIDPDGDTQNYFELEMNALNAVWDLLMIKPYRDTKIASLSGWEMKGLKTCVKVKGTLNKPGDIDSGWTVEAAFPWSSLKEITSASVPPVCGDQWRVNFARAEWKVKISGSTYVKDVDPVTGKQVKSFSSWSPQGLVNLHYPEMWGYVQFTMPGCQQDKFTERKEENAKWYLRRLYYAQRAYFETNKHYAADLQSLNFKAEKITGYKISPGCKK
jgi:YHS domain-containing protein